MSVTSVELPEHETTVTTVNRARGKATYISFKWWWRVRRIVVRLLFCFFFSSRRRHTRCSRDWSSDVCSSDLRSAPQQLFEDARLVLLEDLDVDLLDAVRRSLLRIDRDLHRVLREAVRQIADLRSEERRVGREGRSWGTVGEE